MLSKTITPILL